MNYNKDEEEYHTHPRFHPLKSMNFLVFPLSFFPSTLPFSTNHLVPCLCATAISCGFSRIFHHNVSHICRVFQHHVSKASLTVIIPILLPNTCDSKPTTTQKAKKFLLSFTLTASWGPILLHTSIFACAIDI